MPEDIKDRDILVDHEMSTGVLVAELDGVLVEALAVKSPENSGDHHLNLVVGLVSFQDEEGEDNPSG